MKIFRRILKYSILFSFLLSTPNLLSQTIIGYSDIFAIGTPMQNHPNIIGFTDVFEMNMMGQYFSGYSGFFILNTVGGIIQGQITDNQTGLPIQGAIVKSLTYASSPSDQQGMYKLLVPFGYGYTVSAFASNYEDKSADNIHLPYNNPIKLLNFQLSPGELTVSLSAIQPNPNPAISTVQQGGTFHRYYKVTNSTNGSPRSMIPVTVTANMFSETYLSDEDGIVDISINSNRIGQGQPGEQADFAITLVNNVPLAEPVPFTGKIVNQKYEKTWDSYTTTKLAAPHFSTQIKSGMYSSLNVNGGTVPSSFSISRQLRAGAGVKASASAGLLVQMGDIINGANINAGIGVTISGITQDNYNFPHSSYNSWDAMAQYILITDGSFNKTDQTMIGFLAAIQNEFTNQTSLTDAFEGDLKGLDIKGDVTASAAMGISPLTMPNVNLNANVNIGMSGRVLYDFQSDIANNENIAGIEISGEMSYNAAGGINFILPANAEWGKDLPNLYTVYNQEERSGLRFEAVFTPGTSNIESFRLTFLKRSITDGAGFEKENVYEITGQHAINYIKTINNTVENLVGTIANNASFVVNSTSFRNLFFSVFSKIAEMQSNPSLDAKVSYYVYKKELDKVTPFPIKIVPGFGIKYTFGANIGFEEGRERIVEQGSLIKGKKYPTETFSGAIPNVEVSFQDKMQEITYSVPLNVRLALGLIKIIVNGKNTDDDTYFIGDNGSNIIIPTAAFPPEIDSISVTSWGWYGNSPSKSLTSLEKPKKKIFQDIKKRAEQSFSMTYGIGGFYQFEPYGTELLDTCWMTIVYDQAEADSIDESSLGMYWEDKANHRWVYIGGVLDTANNTVTAPITQLSLFTLAPDMPFGTFGLNAVPDSIYADSISVATIHSDTIFNNNLQPVNNGEKFTVAATYGKILTPDADTAIDGIQVVAANHQIQFEIRSSHIGGTATVSAFSVNGSATASTNIRFYDTIPPAPPVLVEALPDSTTTHLSWLPNTEDDLSGYVLYFDTDTIPPFKGIHTVFGQPSPIYTGTDTTRTVYGLFNDTTYYFTLTAVDVEGNESGYSNFIAAKPFTLSSQKIQLPQGWSGLSSYLTTATDNIESLFQPILSNLIILQNTYGMYWPSQNVNTLGTWNTHEGYQIKVANAVDLTVSGTKENNKTLQLAAGWNLIPVLSECEVDVAALFAGKDVIIVKEVAGWNMYWPEFGINSLGVLEPGKAYFVLMGSEGMIEFPVCGGTKQIPLTGFGTLSGVLKELSSFGITNTAITHTIAIPAQVGNSMNDGDIIAVYDESGNCFGMVNWQSQTTAITLFGNDPTTPIKDGFDENEALSFRLIRDGNEFALDISLDASMPNADKVFGANGLSVIAGIKLSETGISSDKSGSQVQIIPNPAKEEFLLVLPKGNFENCHLEIYRIDGQFVRNIRVTNRETKVDISHFSRGVYMLKIEMDNAVFTKRLVKE